MRFECRLATDVNVIAHQPLHRQDRDLPRLSCVIGFRRSKRAPVETARYFFEPATPLVVQDRLAIYFSAHKPCCINKEARRHLVEKGF